MKTSLVIVAVVAAIALIGVGIGWSLHQPVESLGSVARGGEYHSTVLQATTTYATLLKRVAGALGSIVVNVAGAGNAMFYDATTTNSGLRTVVATSSLRLVAPIDTNLAAGTYTYDSYFNDGLIAVFGGAQGTSTITWR
mgnify:CR=1 FL=1